MGGAGGGAGGGTQPSPVSVIHSLPHPHTTPITPPRSQLPHRCLFSSKYFRINPPNTPGSSFTLRLNSSSGPCHSRASKASLSYSHVPTARSMSDKPRGKRPVLFSRSENSIVLIAASIDEEGKPSRERRWGDWGRGGLVRLSSHDRTPPNSTNTTNTNPTTNHSP